MKLCQWKYYGDGSNSYKDDAAKSDKQDKVAVGEVIVVIMEVIMLTVLRKAVLDIIVIIIMVISEC